MLKLLLVEDSATDAHLVQRVVNREKLADEIVWITDGAAALQLLTSEQRNEYQMVLLDIKLPKVTGLDVLQELYVNRQLDECPPIVVFSSSSIEKDIKLAMENGAADFCTKPEGYRELKLTLKQLCERWMSTN